MDKTTTQTKTNPVKVKLIPSQNKSLHHNDAKNLININIAIKQSCSFIFLTLPWVPECN